MSDIMGLSEAKRALFEKYAHGRLSQSTKSARVIPKRPEGSVVQLSFGQQQMWLLSHLIPNAPVYNESATIHLPGRLNVAAFEQGFREVVRRHEAWRTSFPVVDGQPVQSIHPNPPFSLPAVDLRHLPQAEREGEAVRLATEAARLPFDLAQGPLFRATLMQLDNEEYRLFMTMHHIIFDGTTLYQVFLPELFRLYEAFSADQPSPLAELPIQYADFASWQRKWLQEEAFVEQLAYWKRQLARAPTALNLPTDRPRPAVKTYWGAKKLFAFSQQLTDAIKSLSSREGVTLFMTLQAAFNTLLYRYTGQEDIVIGTISAGRTHSELQKLMGYFANPLVLRTDLAGNPSFRELLTRVREVTLEAYAHQDMPFEYLVKELRPQREPGQNSLFQVMLTLEPQQPALPSGWTATYLDVQLQTSKFDLFLGLDDLPEGIAGWLEYSTDLFDEATIARMVSHWQTLLESVVANPDHPISTLAILPDDERQQLLHNWNTTQAAYPLEQSVVDLFHAQVARTPHALAARCEDQQLSYRELDRRATQLAHHLRTLGVGPDVLVGLGVERSLEMLVGLLGILKAGGTYVPLDPGYPTERLAFLLADAAVPVLLTQQRLRERFPTTEGTTLVCLDTHWPTIAQQPSTPLACPLRGEHAAYLLYTSGSTGQPKGVLGTHRGILNRLWWMWHAYPFQAGDVCCQKTSLNFVDSVWELFGPLLAGVPSVLIPDRVLKDPTLFVQTLASEQVTRLVLVPSLLRVLLEDEEQVRTRLSHLRLWISSGEALPVDLAARLRHCFPRSVLLNLYGSSEVAADVTCYELSGEQETVSLARVPIGRPIANTQIYLLDRAGHLVPIGVPGEICVGGAGLAQGYFQRPDLTRERFVAHPLSEAPGARLFKTGDWARYRVDGTLELLGRRDQQIKLRGHRIELGEIEAALAQHPGVQQAVVVVREDGAGNPRLVAYVIPRAQTQPTSSELRSFLKTKLPEVMVPAASVVRESLPLLPNGKLDRRALPAPEEGQGEQEAFVAPRTPSETLVATVWSHLLGLERLDIHQDFFDLGGHSLLAMQVISRLRTIVQVEIPLSSFFEAPTVAQFAEMITQLQTQGAPIQRPSLRARSRDDYRMSRSASLLAQQSAEFHRE